MAQSTRLRRRRSDQGKGSKKRSASKQPSRAAKKRKKDYAAEFTVEETVNDAEQDAQQEQGDEELFKVEKIVDFKLDRNGVPLYKTRWKGYSAADDTWEPQENVASTGHVDRWERQQRQKTLKRNTPGVAIIEYEDGEREMVDLKMEKFRGYHPDSSDDDRDDDTVDGDDDVNNFSLVVQGEWIEILWPHTSMYFPCKVVSWVRPRENKKPQKKRSRDSSRKVITEEVEESSVAASVHSNQKEVRASTKRSKRKVILEDEEETSVSNSVQIQQKESKVSSKRSRRQDDNLGGQNKKQNTIVPPKKVELELAQTGSTQEMFWRDENEITQESAKDEHDSDDDSDSDSSGFSRSVERVGHGIPLFDEPEDDFESDDDESDSDDEEEGDGIHTHQHQMQFQRPRLTFEEQWMLKLRRTQEMIDRGS